MIMGILTMLNCLRKGTEPEEKELNQMSQTNENVQEELYRKQLEEFNRKKKAQGCASVMGCIGCGPWLLIPIILFILFVLAAMGG